MRNIPRFRTIKKKPRIEIIQDIADKFQDHCHSTIEHIKNNENDKITYQDAFNTWLFTQLAELELYNSELMKRVEKLETKNKRVGGF